MKNNDTFMTDEPNEDDFFLENSKPNSKPNSGFEMKDKFLNKKFNLIQNCLDDISAYLSSMNFEKLENAECVLDYEEIKQIDNLYTNVLRTVSYNQDEINKLKITIDHYLL